MNRKCIKILFLLGFFVFTNLSGIAQYAPEYYKYKEKYPNAHLVRLNQETNLIIKLKKGKLDITREVLQEDLYMDELATYNSKKSVDFSSFFELSNIEASSYVYDKNDYEELKVNEFTESDRMDQSFHDDSKLVSYVYSNLHKGSKSKLEYSEKIKDPRFLPSFYFGDFFPVINNKFTIIADKDVQLEFKKFNVDTLHINYTEEEKRGNKIYRWELKNVCEYPNEDNAPSYKKILPHIIPVFNSYKANQNQIPVLDNTNDLYHWYFGLTKDLNKDAPNEELVKLVTGLIKDKTTELEKVKAIYYWVQYNIKYIAFEYELGGFVPREANSVFKKKYGDCKDNSSILEQMLSIANIQGNLTWVGTRSIPYKYENLPTPAVDNHMILSYSTNDKRYFLDATGRYLPIDYPSAFIQGKEALIGNKNGTFTIVNVPIVPADQNRIDEVTHIKLEGNKIIGNSKAQITGYFKVNINHYLETKNKESDRKELYKAFLEKGNNKFLISNFTERNKFDYDKAFVIDYDFSIEDYAKIIGDEIYVNLNLDKSVSTYKTKDDRKLPVEQEFKKSLSYTTTFEIPKDYKVAYLPEDLKLENKFIKAEISYAQEENKLVYKHHIDLDFLELSLEQQQVFNTAIEKIEKAYKEIIVLKKIK